MLMFTCTNKCVACNQIVFIVPSIMEALKERVSDHLSAARSCGLPADVYIPPGTENFDEPQT